MSFSHAALHGRPCNYCDLYAFTTEDDVKATGPEIHTLYLVDRNKDGAIDPSLAVTWAALRLGKNEPSRASPKSSRGCSSSPPLGIEVDPLQPIVILDVGDEDVGFSMTVGDGGPMGDDAGPGRADDVRIRIGGAMSPASATLTHDLPNSWSDRVVHVAFTFDPSGDLVL